MRCPESGTWWIYLDGELPSIERERLQDHLLTCKDCEREVWMMHHEADLIAASLAAEPVPEDLMAVIERRLDRRADAERSGIKIILPMLVFISTLLAIGLGWLPQLEHLNSTWGQFFHQGVLLDCFLFLVRLGQYLGGAALDGGPLLPATALLLVCIIWLKLSIRKGGYARG